MGTPAISFMDVDGIDQELLRRGVHPDVIAKLAGSQPSTSSANADLIKNAGGMSGAPAVSPAQPGSRDYNLRLGATSQPTPPVSFMGPKPEPSAPDLQPAVPAGSATSFVQPGRPAKPAAIGDTPTTPAQQTAPPISFAQRFQELNKQEPTRAQFPVQPMPAWKKILGSLAAVAGGLKDPNQGGASERALLSSPQRKADQQFDRAHADWADKEGALTKEIGAANVESEIRARGDKDEQALAKIGMKRGPDGAITPDENSEIYKAQQSKIQIAEEAQKGVAALRDAQTELAQARTEVEKAKNDPESPAYKQAQSKLQMAQRAHDIAAQNLGLHQAEFANKVQEQELIKPSGQSQSRGSAAQAVLDLIPDLEKNVRANAKEMGPTMGRLNRGEIAVGNVSPDVARLYSAMKSFYALQPAVHGFRNAEFVKDFETALGTLERDPESFIAGMQGLKPTLESVAKEGKTSHKRIVEGRDTPNAAAPAFKVPDGAPVAPKEDNKLLKMNGQTVAKSKGGQWVAP